MDLQLQDLSMEPMVTELPARRMAEPAELRLAISIMTSTIGDLVKYRHRSTETAAQLYDEARDWLRSTDDKWPFSFENICYLLDLPADRLRAELLRDPAGLENFDPYLMR